ncbi:MAG: xylulokinase [Lautropia sp.]|nr:xylulokinase [Lautropia sp.]
MHLGIDLGTSELKLLLLDDDHQIIGTAHEALPISRPQPLWSEQNPDDWWQALQRAMSTLVNSHSAALAHVRDIGLSGQMHGAVLLDEQGDILRPAILWNDGRASAECEQLAAHPALLAHTGNLAMPGFTAPKLLWVREHEPELFARVHKVLLPKDWLRFKLSGEHVSEMSDAAGTLWLDVGRRAWSEDMLAATGLSLDQMPSLVEGSQASARLRPELAHRWGMADQVVIAGGGGDNAASAIGISAIHPGQGFVSLGTSGVIFVVTDRFAPNPDQAVHAFCHALPSQWHQMSVMLSAASAVSWAAAVFGFADVPALLAAAAECRQTERHQAPLFLPYLSGERSPHNDAHAQGVLFGLNASHGPAALAYAVVEGVSFGLRDGLDTLMPPSSLILTGGGARSDWWSQLLANVLQVALMKVAGGETGGALGAARLGWLAGGGELAQVCPPPAALQTFEPDATQTGLLDERLARFRGLYPLMRAGWHE